MSDDLKKRCLGRPRIHYAPHHGWLNDPNGLIYVDGKWLIFHQYNPVSTEWGNMHWAALETTDFIAWKDKGIVMEPDEEGTIFSGCAIWDKENLLGYGNDKILYYYTAAGGYSEASKGKKFVQKLAYSDPKGNAIHKTGKTVIPYIKEGTRDPKVFYHQASKAYIMILQIESGCFYIYRSEDLLNWEKTQEFHDEVMDECPDLFAVKQNGGQRERWVLWSAHGYYYLGDFDGYCFTKKSKRQQAYVSIADLNDLNQVSLYAAQTFSNVEDKVVQMAWIRCNTAIKGYNGQLSIPVVITMAEDAKELRFNPYETNENEERAKKAYAIIGSDSEGEQKICELDDAAYKLNFKFKASELGEIQLQILDETIKLLWKEQQIIIGENKLSFEQQEQIDIEVFVDTDVFEIFALGGRYYGVISNQKQELSGEVKISSIGNVDGTVEVTKLNSIEIKR